MDQIGPNRTKLTKVNQMGLNGPNRTELNEVDRMDLLFFSFLFFENQT